MNMKRTEHFDSSKTVNYRGIEPISEGSNRNPAGSHDKLLNGAESQTLVERGSVVWGKG